MAKPFHESIVDLLGQVGTTLGHNIAPFAVSMLATLIRETIIPKNHDAIAKALVAQAIDSQNPGRDVTQALAHIESEKQRCAEEARNKVE